MFTDRIGIKTVSGKTVLFDNSIVRNLVSCIGVAVECVCDIGDCDACPWWWCADLISRDFYGGVIHNIDTDTVTDTLDTDGTVCDTFYRPKNSEREITFTGMMFAKNSAALNWGVERFQAKLEELNSCTTNELFYLKACPCEDQDYQDMIGFIPSVKLKAGITVTEHMEVCCDCDGVGVEFKFTLSARNSSVFVDAQECLNGFFPPDVECVDFDCEPCKTVETQAVEVQYNRKPYLVKVSRNSWCPVGWEIDPMDFPPADGYFDIIETTESTAQPCFIRLTQTVVDGPISWEPIRWDYTLGDPIPCDCKIEIAEICAPTGTSSCTSVTQNKNTLITSLNIDGSVTIDNWDGLGVFPPLYSELALSDACGCTSVSLDDNEIQLNQDGTWTATNWVPSTADFFPPDNLTIANQTFTYTVVEDVPISNLVGGCGQPIKPSLIPVTDLECYCEPWEYLQSCCEVDWVCGGSWAAKIVVTGGAIPAKDLRISIYPKRLGEPSYCDDKDFYRCRNKSVDVWVPKIPAKQQLVFDGRTGDKTYIYGAGSEGNGGTWFEPLSYHNLTGADGATVVATINAHNGDGTSPTDVKVSVVFYRRTNVLLPS